VDLNREPRQIAYAAAEEIRALNHRTLDPKAMPNPGDVAGTIEGLHALLQRLPQAIEQLQQALQGMGDRQEVRMDNGSDPSESVLAACRGLWEAEERARGAESALQAVVNQVSHMGGHFTDEDDDAHS
jgi:hypothetical protein